jgi:outer membrane immunogenic protein
MKQLFLTIAFFSAFALASAQSPLPVGKTQLNFGVGFSGYGIPIYLGLDVSVHKDITLGGELSFRTYSDDFNGSKYGHSIMGFSGNGNYHFNSLMNIPRDWDFYAGLNLGFYTWTSPSDYPGVSHTSGLGLGAQIGGRYYFSEKGAINLEIGGGSLVSGGKIGLTFKL